MNPVDFFSVSATAMARIKKGAFLTVQANELRNTMTIGWAMTGFCWGKQVFMVAVRDSRHTFGLMEKAADFTVSIPAEPMRKEIMFCGTKSGRDVDKFEACQLGLRAGQEVKSPVIDIAGLHFECRIVYKSAMDAQFLLPDYQALYHDKDYHSLYFGQLMACYEI